ncbi:carbohydrate ABC transporter permease [Marinicrinis sediminis]|uniref:Carbohydrate ABC transporter permease n=1 Tax=Marinicrinis sediminis TaxID=1652465 RepID=A0ABW5RDJ5_9BACL
MRERGLYRWSSMFVFMGPAIIIFSLFVVIPIIMSIFYSFFEWDAISPRIYTGLDNYVQLIQDPIVWKALKNSILLTVFALIIQLPVGLFLAVLLSYGLKGSNLFKTVYFIPVMLSTAVLGILWGQIYDPNFGLLNHFLMQIGLEKWTQVWLGDPNYALGSVITVVAWQYIGFYVVVYFSALQNVPDEVLESARIEGASEWKILLQIRIPLIWHVITFTVLNCVVNSLKYFDLIWIMTQGGPNNESEVIASYMMKNAFTLFDYGYGSTISTFLFVFGLTVALLLSRLLKREAITY